MKTATLLFTAIIFLICSSITKPTYGQEQIMSYKDYIRNAAAAKKEIDVFLNENSWAQFDPDVVDAFLRCQLDFQSIANLQKNESVPEECDAVAA